MVVHHSRNTAAKQWSETLVLILQGVRLPCRCVHPCVLDTCTSPRQVARLFVSCKDAWLHGKPSPDAAPVEGLGLSHPMDAWAQLVQLLAVVVTGNSEGGGDGIASHACRSSPRREIVVAGIHGLFQLALLALPCVAADVAALWDSVLPAIRAIASFLRHAWVFELGDSQALEDADDVAQDVACAMIEDAHAMVLSCLAATGDAVSERRGVAVKLIHDIVLAMRWRWWHLVVQKAVVEAPCGPPTWEPCVSCEFRCDGPLVALLAAAACRASHQQPASEQEAAVVKALHSRPVQRVMCGTTPSATERLALRCIKGQLERVDSSSTNMAATIDHVLALGATSHDAPVQALLQGAESTANPVLPPSPYAVSCAQLLSTVRREHAAPEPQVVNLLSIALKRCATRRAMLCDCWQALTCMRAVNTE